MEHEPRIEQRAKQPYVAIAAHVTSEAEFRSAADSGFPELFGWLREHGVAPAGPLFIRFLALDGKRDPRDVELAVPVESSAAGDGRIQAGSLPAGRYVTFLHAGPYSSATEPDLAAAHTTLLEWADEQGVALDRRDTDDGTTLGACVERYLIGPVEEPDHSKWRTEVAYLVAAPPSARYSPRRS